MKFSHVSLFILALIGFQACTGDHTYSEYRDIPGLKWAAADTMEFDIDIPQTASYSMAVSARHRKDYEFSNLWIQVMIKGPALDTGFRYEMALFNAEGRPYGESSGSTCTQTIPLKGIGKLEKGKYSVRLVHLMRKDPIDGVQNIGVIVDPK